MMYAQLIYGGRYLLLRTIDLCCFSWHGWRPLSWQMQLITHNFCAPHGGVYNPFGTAEERAALEKAQALYPDRHMYLGLGSRYSPWYGYQWGHDVKVLVTDRKGTPPTNKYGGSGCWGMKWKHFLQTEWVDKQKRKL